MTVTRFGKAIPLLNAGLGSTTQIPSGGTAGQVITANGSNGAYWGENIARITANGSNANPLVGPFVNFAAGSNIVFSWSSNSLNIGSTGGSGGGGTTITTKDEGSTLSSTVTTLDFVGAGVTASGAGATTTVTIPGGSGGSLVLLEQHTASSSATLDFTTFISSTYDRYLITFDNILPATNNVALWMRCSTDGGSTYDTSAIYDYSHFAWSTGGAGAVSAAVGQAQILVTYPGTGILNTTPAFAYNGHLHLVNPQTATYNTVVERGSNSYLFSGTATILDSLFSASYKNTADVDAVRFLMSSGNISSGTIYAYGIPK